MPKSKAPELGAVNKLGGALALAGAALIIWQVARVTLAKADHKLKPALEGAKLEKGPLDGQAYNTLSMLGDAQGNFYHLDRMEGQWWRIQKFDLGMAFKGLYKHDLARKPGAWAARMAMAPDGRLMVGLEDGKILDFTQDLKPLKSWDTGLSGMRAMDMDPQGRLLLLGTGGGKLEAFTLPEGGGQAQPAETPLTALKFRSLYFFTLGKGGELVALEALAQKQEQRVRIHDAEGKLRASFINRYIPVNVHAAAVDGEGRIYMNENIIGLGVSVFDLEGRYHGRITHYPPKLELDKSGFVGANLHGGEFYLNYREHLAKFRLHP